MSDYLCLLVDFADQVSETWQKVTSKISVSFEFRYVTAEEAEAELSTGMVTMIALFCDQETQFSDVYPILQNFREKVGPLSHFQSMIIDEPSAQFINDVYEFGLETFLSMNDWANEFGAWARDIQAVLEDESASEKKIIEISRSIARGDQGGIAQAEQSLGDAHEYDYLAAYSKANALQAVGKFAEAVDAFKASGEMNKKFRPADSKLGENLMVVGRVDEAIEVFDRLERVNSRDADRKAMLASAYIEKGDVDKANELIDEAKNLNPDNPKIREAQAQMYLATGKAGLAFQMMDQLEEVGPFLAAKLNEMGIRLSQTGKGKNALALYQKAHKVVRKELKYKVSMNAALACYRLKMFDMALKYLNRCEKEYGRKLEKVTKIRAACHKAVEEGQAEEAEGA